MLNAFDIDLLLDVDIIQDFRIWIQDSASFDSGFGSSIQGWFVQQWFGTVVGAEVGFSKGLAFSATAYFVFFSAEDEDWFRSGVTFRIFSKDFVHPLSAGLCLLRTESDFFADYCDYCNFCDNCDYCNFCDLSIIIVIVAILVIIVIIAIFVIIVIILIIVEHFL